MVGGPLRAPDLAFRRRPSPGERRPREARGSAAVGRRLAIGHLAASLRWKPRIRRFIPDFSPRLLAEPRLLDRVSWPYEDRRGRARPVRGARREGRLPAPRR